MTDSFNHAHDFRFDGDDPYLICACGARRDALTGLSVPATPAASIEGAAEAAIRADFVTRAEAPDIINRLVEDRLARAESTGGLDVDVALLAEALFEARIGNPKDTPTLAAMLLPALQRCYAAELAERRLSGDTDTEPLTRDELKASITAAIVDEDSRDAVAWKMGWEAALYTFGDADTEPQS